MKMKTYPVSPADATLPEPPMGDGRYYLARGLTDCPGAEFGVSSLTPDPRDVLAAGPCPGVVSSLPPVGAALRVVPAALRPPPGLGPVGAEAVRALARRCLAERGLALGPG